MHSYMIRELRDMTGLTQKAFSEMYGIPLSTLRKWEHGESSPPPYVISLLARTLPATDESLQKITGRSGSFYFYDRLRKIVSDRYGNQIKIREDLNKVKDKNLAIYLQDLFDAFYEIQEKFDRDCRFDQEEDYIWTRNEE